MEIQRAEMWVALKAVYLVELWAGWKAGAMAVLTAAQMDEWRAALSAVCSVASMAA
jgi:hypothetical protein